MTPEQALAVLPKVLTRAQRERYFADGYLLLESFLAQELVEQLRAVTAEMVERSRALTVSDSAFDLEPDHTAAAPRLRRLSSPVVHHPAYWDYATGVIADIAADLVGPDVKFHHSKLNFKWARGGAEVRWHQDIPGWPHTNYSPLTIGTYLFDTGMEQGPLAVLPGSHEGPIYDEYDADGRWVAALSDADVATLDLGRTRCLTGPAGSLTIHNCRLLHSSPANLSDLGRPLLLNVYSSADAFTYTPNPLPTPYAGQIVRGRPARWARHDPRPCLIPPDWSKGFTSIFAIQQGGGAATM
jgi:hypothetical protein